MHHRDHFHLGDAYGRRGQRHRAADGPEGDEEPRGRRGCKELWAARRDLKSALRGKWDASAEEQQRIVGILQRATAEILGKTGN
jgi:hypothetical protein